MGRYDRGIDPSPQRRATLSPLVLAAWVLAAVLVLPQPWHQLRVPIDPMIDLHVYRDAGLSLLHHNPVYAHYTITRASVLPFTYPPLAALLAVPLALVPFGAAMVAWDVAVYAALLCCLRWSLAGYRARLRRDGAGYEPLVLPAAFVVACWLLPGRQQVHFGQVGVLLMTLVMADLLTPVTGRWRGVLVGLATAIKLTPGVFIVGLWLAGRRRTAGMAAATVVLLTGLSALVAPGSARAYWTSALFASDRLGNNADPTNQSLRGIVLRTPLVHLSATLMFLALAAVVGTVGLRKAAAAWQAGDELTAVALVGLLSALLSPVAWIHHFVYLFPLLAVLVRDGRRLLAAALAAMWLFDLPAAGHALLGVTWLPLAGLLGWLLEAALCLSMAAVVLWLPVPRPARSPRPARPSRPGQAPPDAGVFSKPDLLEPARSQPTAVPAGRP
jgi:alpha-1,2-mannosyltransferase